MGTYISILNALSSSIWGGILILFPELVFAYIAFNIVKDEEKRVQIFLRLTAILLIIYIGLGVMHFALTYNLLEHSNADYKNGTRWNVSISDSKGNPLFDGITYGLSNGLQVDWGFGTPRKNRPEDTADHFSAIFSTSVDFNSGYYCFVMTVDDGANLLVGDQVLMSHYYGFTPGAIFKKPIQLDTRNYSISIQYYEDINAANIFVYWYELHGDECESVNEP